MSPTPGSRLGIYEVIAPLGAGGMGEVYRARDTKLGRDVAIKALPPQFAQDPDRLARFEREAKLLASLTHPHIAGIFGLEDIDNHRYLVLEFVEGETLAQRLDHGTLTIEESLQICRQIASALESAHESGIAHRDLKPGNVMITPSGDVKVLDFGLAKGGMGSGSGSDVSLSHSPTMTHQQTSAGVILGTAAYMSPEQARGRVVDKRTDIWSFGCVLYECLSGRQAFAGETVSDLIARILEREPDWDALPSRTPQRIRDLLRRCLDKDSKRRLRDIGDARIEIDDVIATRTSSPEATAAAARRSRGAAMRWGGVLALFLATAAGTYVVSGQIRPAPPAEVNRFEIAEMPGTHIDFDGVHPAISPDGRTLAYRAADSTGVPRLWIRALSSLQARELPGTDGAANLFWSPDSKFVGFFSNRKLRKIAIDGGTPETICDITVSRGGTWGPDGVILLAPQTEGPIHRVSANGGESVALTKLDATETAHRYPCFLPDGKHFLYAALPPHDGKYRIYFASLDGKERTLVLDSASSGATYAAPGYLIYERGDVLVAHKFDASSGRVVGEPVSLGDHPVGTESSGARLASVSSNGDLAYTTNIPFASHLVWSDLNSKPVETVPMAPGKYISLALSPDDHSAILESSARIGVSDLWLVDLERGVATKFSTNAGENSNACWSADGTRVAYTWAPPGEGQRIMVAAVGGGGPPEMYLQDDPSYKDVFGFSPDGRSLVIGRQEAATRRDLWILPLEGDHKPVPYLVTPDYEGSASLSPDGKWLMYDSDESGRNEVYVQSFPQPGHKYQVTTRGGFGHGWSRDGKKLGYSGLDDPTTVYGADVLAGAQFRLGPAKAVAHTPDTGFDFAGSRDMTRMLLLLPARPPSPQTITVVQNWPALLAKK
jgi:Tol biopolymer transport system component/tRNA A-37 threonylcarbamoyl transferase component Bud32